MGKIQSHLSPEKYIKTKARSLPIHECWINKEWEESGLASILVSRRQPSGNLTVGIYLVDLKCLGVKDTVYYFNYSAFEYNDLMKSQMGAIDLISCDYALAHNVIFAALEFAGEHNIMPERDFAITKFILEDDEDESIPLIDIECGEDGMPHLILPEDQVQKYTKVLAQLRSYPGEGNFLYTIQTEDGDYDGNSEEDDESDWGHEPLPDDFFDKVENGEASIKDESIHAVIDLMYRKKFPEHIVDIQSVGKYADSLDISYDPLDDIDSMSEYESGRVEELYDMFQANPEEAVPILFDLTERYPMNKTFGDFLYMALMNCDMTDEAKTVAEKNYRKFPGYLFAQLNYATYLTDNGRYDEARDVMHDPSALGAFISGRPVQYIEAASFFAFWCIYYLKTGDISKAEFYYRVVWWLGPHNERVEMLGNMLSKAKTEAIGIQ